jgi:phosphate-selective porin OprO/OprP
MTRRFPFSRLALAVLALVVLARTELGAQQLVRPDSARRPVEFTSRGLVFNGSDGFSYLALRFRLQEWAVLATDDDQSGIASSTFAVRRARVRFESVVWDPRLKVNVQLSFSRGDMDFENSRIPNILRDYTVQWQATPRFSVMAGQTKLPGNRQRVISSGEQQFTDRTIVNGAFTIDRDMGFWAQYNAGTSRPVILRAAVTSGEGRAVQTGNAGLAYTGRVELQPLGAFLGGGDYFEGDLLREPTPKLSVGATFSHNEQAERAGGQLGPFLFEPRDMQTTLLDVLLKYRGFSASAELARRSAADPITTDGVETRFVLTGTGVTMQAAYLTPANIEFGARFSVVDPHRDVETEEERHRQVSGVITRYFRGHRVKMQAELIRDDFRDRITAATRGGWSLRTSLEVGI